MRKPKQTFTDPATGASRVPQRYRRGDHPYHRTFLDPHTGEEMESTFLARLVSGFAYGLSYGLIYGVGLYSVSVYRVTNPQAQALFWRMMWWHILILSASMGVLLTRLNWEYSPNGRRILWKRIFHDPIARWQHQRRKLKLTDQEWTNIPAGSLQKTRLTEDLSERAVSVAVTPEKPDHE